MNKEIINYISEHFKNTGCNLLVIGPGRSQIISSIISEINLIGIDMIDHNSDALVFQKSLLSSYSGKTNFIDCELTKEFPATIVNNKYDLILCTEVIEHVKNNGNLIDHINKLLKSSGICMISVPNGFIDKLLLKIDKGYMRNGDLIKGHVNFYSRKQFRRLLNFHKFEIIKFKGISSEYSIFHLILVLFKIHIDEDTGQIREINRPSVKWGARIMRIMDKTKINLLFNYIIPRNYFAIVKQLR
ncbi:MAG TPA: class I SAM-dependent methyltransferase [Bacteroidales bacterium]|nr:class I SAM-dependent methyltransferase [Bacteroidales bacterium]